MIIGYLPIYDTNNLSSKNLKLAFDFLSSCLNNKQFPSTKIDLKGDEIFALFSENIHEKELQLESHLKYIDIHFVIDGVDRFAYAPKAMDGIKELSCDVENDLVLYSGNFELEFELRPNFFVVFFPEDIHASCYKLVANKKLVIKVAV
jgi:biofilm protein TabA